MPRTPEQNRPLTTDEQRRLEQFELLSAQMEEQGYAKHELIIGIVKANIIAFAAAIPLFLVGFALYVLVNAGRADFDFNVPVAIVALVVLFVVHELIHGLTWSVFAPNHWGDIAFGFMRKYFTPYCACKAPLSRGHYVLGALMPLLTLGLLPTAIGIVIGSFTLFMIGIVMTLAAIGDVMIVVRVLAFRPRGTEVLYLDHPTLAGVVAFER